MKIMLDAGHGFNTPGKRSPNGMREYEFTRAVAEYAKNSLGNYQNITVYFAHSDERDVPLKERTDKANQLNVDAYVAIHANAYGSSWNTANGIETYVFPTKPKEAYELAQMIQKNLVISTGLTDRGVKTADFHVLRESHMTAVLTECGFMTNEREAELMLSDMYRKTCAEAIVKALANQFKLKLKADPGTNSPSSNNATPLLPSKPANRIGLYKVQVGAFKNKKNADDLANVLKKLGYSPYVYFE
jgi:N-acetylmuramoyl-L-alanine amidase